MISISPDFEKKMSDIFSTKQKLMNNKLYELTRQTLGVAHYLCSIGRRYNKQDAYKFFSWYKKERIQDIERNWVSLHQYSTKTLSRVHSSPCLQRKLNHVFKIKQMLLDNKLTINTEERMNGISYYLHSTGRKYERSNPTKFFSWHEPRWMVDGVNVSRYDIVK